MDTHYSVKPAVHFSTGRLPNPEVQVVSHTTRSDGRGVYSVCLPTALGTMWGWAAAHALCSTPLDPFPPIVSQSSTAQSLDQRYVTRPIVGIRQDFILPVCVLH